ncbi:MAG: hypothetical protein LQ350_001502 [Teloschistes chrysophthalmus]|nr:MAG: hypothetical protein LQ350_001502 [Niorma chrysophthalma]
MAWGNIIVKAPMLLMDRNATAVLKQQLMPGTYAGKVNALSAADDTGIEKAPATDLEWMSKPRLERPQ